MNKTKTKRTPTPVPTRENHYNGWDRVRIKPIPFPRNPDVNVGEGQCAVCDWWRESTYYVKYANGTICEYCVIHAWTEVADYLWGITGERLFERERHTKFAWVARIELTEVENQS